MKSVMNHRFSQVPSVEIPRSSFNRSSGLKTTFNSGDIIPVFVDEALPGDTFNLKMNAFTRLATPINPFMDNLHLDTFFFAVPIRLIWENFQKFNGEQTNPGDSTDYLIPTMTSPPSTGYDPESLSDYFGIPTQIPDLEHSALWHRAYNLIYNEWFRDQNLIDSAFLDKTDLADDPANFPIQKRNKRHDYFTSCLPWPQKGEAVDLPIGDSAPITYTGGLGDEFPAQIRYASSDTLTVTVNDLQHGSDGEFMSQGTQGVYIDPNGTLVADLSDATAATINELRQAFQLQRLYERDARGGSRYTEIIRSHFGVTSPDARLQRPEYLGGGSSRININPVAQTSETGTTTPQGNLSAFGVGTIQNHGFTKSFTEHCIIMGFVNVRADLTYQQGLDRMFSRSTRWDFFWPALSHIGEQAVLNKEIFAQDPSIVDPETQLPMNELVFGYQERYAEYRYKQSKITGKFRSNDPQPLDTWHLAQDFDDLPLLNQSFIEDNPPVERVVVVQDEPQFIMDTFFDLNCARPMPIYGTPGMIDHF